MKTWNDVLIDKSDLDFSTIDEETFLAFINEIELSIKLKEEMDTHNSQYMFTWVAPVLVDFEKRSGYFKIANFSILRNITDILNNEFTYKMRSEPEYLTKSSLWDIDYKEKRVLS
jgi:hypothetical protein